MDITVSLGAGICFIIHIREKKSRVIVQIIVDFWNSNKHNKCNHICWFVFMKWFVQFH